MNIQGENPFADNWRDCLRAHYIHVIKEGDRANEASLFAILIDSGLTEVDLQALRLQSLAENGIVETAVLLEETEIAEESQETDEAPIEVMAAPAEAEIEAEIEAEYASEEAVQPEPLVEFVEPETPAELLMETPNEAVLEAALPEAISENPVEEIAIEIPVSTNDEQPPEEPPLTQMSLF